MGRTILETDGGVVARIIAAGDAHGFDTPRPAIVIATPSRARNTDYLVLTIDEMKLLADSIMSYLAEK